jgi:hypothetical protein
MQKRAREEQEEEHYKVASINWRRFAPSQLNPPTYSVSQGAYGGWRGKRTYGPRHDPILITGPAMRVAYDPGVWDDDKQSKFGKEPKGLDPNRKSDKWSIDLVASDEFVQWLYAYRNAIAAGILLRLATFMKPSHPDFAGMDAKTVANKFFPLVKSDKDGRWIFKLDGRCDVGAKDVDMTLVDREGAPLAANARLGKGSLVAPVFRADDDYVNATFQNVKLYMNPIKFVVLEHVPPQSAVQAASVVPELDDD